MAAPLLRIDTLKAGPQPPLTFEVASGECLAVEGPSGAGKTCLLRAIADLDASTGQIFLDGAERSEMPAPAWRKLVRLVSSEPGWWGDTPRASLPPVTSDVERAARDGKLQRLLGSLGLDMAKLDQPVATLSTGERTRLALARALIDEPRVLLLDEPTAALDPTSAALVEELIRYQLLAGRTLLLVSHDAAQVARLADAHLILPAPKRTTLPDAPPLPGAARNGRARPAP